jgi:tetratricopeptide (TPR) repeat protein
VIVLVIAGVIGVGGLVRVWSWQGRLAEAARAVTPVAEMSLRLGTVGTPRPMLAGDTPERIRHDLSMLLGRPVGVGSSAINAAMGELEAGRSRIAVERLREALELCPRHIKTRRALSRLLLREAGARWAAGDHPAAVALGDEAELLALEGTHLDPDRTMTWAWLGTVRRARWQIEHEPKDLERAVEAWERAATMDPHGLSFPKRIYEALRELGDDERAKAWGERLLELDRSMRLDPLRGLTERERGEVARFVRGS